MSQIKYNGITISPAPQVSISRAITNQGNDAEISRLFSVSLEGDLIPQLGGTDYTGQTTDPAHYMDVVFRKSNSLRDAFSTPGLPLEIVDNSGLTVLSLRPFSIQVDFPTNYYTQDVKYNVSLQTYAISSCVSNLTIHTGLYPLKSASDDISFQVADDSVEITRNIQAQGQGDGSNRDMAYLAASSWCYSNLGNINWYPPLKSFMSTTYADTIPTFAGDGGAPPYRALNINYSRENGNYALTANYTVPRTSSQYYIDNLTAQTTQCDDRYFNLSVNYSVRGIGKNIAERNNNITYAFTDRTTTAGICSSIFDKSKSYWPVGFSTATNTISFEVINFNASEQKNEGTATYDVGYRVTTVTSPVYPDIYNWGIQGAISFDERSGKFTISANGTLNKTATNQSFSIPSFTKIMSYFAGKGIVPAAWSSKSELVRVEKNYDQNNSLYGWNMQIEGNAVVWGSVTLPIMVDRQISHTITPKSWREEISDNTVISLGTSLFDPNTFAMNTIPAALATTKNDFIGCSAYTLPTSTYFTTTRTPIMNSCMVNEMSLSDGTIFQYQVSRNFSVCPYDIALYVPTTIPIEDINISVQRNYDTLVTRPAQIPGRQYGAIFQNLKTFSNPEVAISIQLTLGRKLSTGLLSIFGNYQPGTNEAFMFDQNATGTNSFINNINLQGMADAILRSVVGSNLIIDRELNDFKISGAAAIVKSENDSYNPIGGTYQYAVNFVLVNLGYRG